MMMTPPIVGVPFFCIWPSRPRLRMVSPIWWRWSQAIIFLPAKKAISMLITAASRALNDR